MNLLNTDQVKALQKQSNDELNIFTNTVERLENINKKINFERAKRLEKIDTLQQENQSLSDTQERNNKLLGKLKDFLEL